MVGPFFLSGEVGAGYPGQPDRPGCYLKWGIFDEISYHARIPIGSRCRK